MTTRLLVRGAGVAGGVLVAAFALLWWQAGALSVWAQGSAIGGAVLLCLYAFLDSADDHAPRTDAQAAFVSALLVVLTAVGGGFAVATSVEWEQEFDFSRDGKNSLSSRSRNVLQSLEGDLTAYLVFSSASPERAKVTQLFERLERAAGSLSVVSVNPLTQPGLMQQITRATGRDELDRLSERGAVILVYGQRRRRLESRWDENAIINAIVRLQSEEDRRICWIVGHQERDPDDEQSGEGWGSLIVRLEDRNVVVTEESLATGRVPEGCEAVMVVGSRGGWLPAESKALETYVSGGGSAFLVLDSVNPEGGELAAFDGVLNAVGIRRVAGVVLENEPSNVVGTPSGELLYVYGAAQQADHPVMPRGMQVTVRWPVAFQVDAEAGSWSPQGWLSSSERSWSETSLDLLGTESPSPDEGEVLGPLVLMAASERAAAFGGQGRVVVIGDSDIGSNALSSIAGNGDLLLNAISWMLSDEAQLGVESATAQQLVLSDAQQWRFIGVGLFLIPLFTLVMGVLAAFRFRLRRLRAGGR